MVCIRFHSRIKTKYMIMKILIKYLIVASLLISALSGCKKGGSTVPVPVIPDTTKPTISIIKPTPGGTIRIKP